MSVVSSSDLDGSKRQGDGSTSQLMTSIIICTRNRADKLRQTLHAVLAMDRALDYEVLVIDNGSTDHTQQVCADVECRFEGRLRVIYEPRRGSAAARNSGIQAARGDIVAFLDDDIVPRRNWLTVVRDEFSSDPTLSAISGRVELFNSADLPTSIRRQTERSAFTSIGDAFNLFIGCNQAFRRCLIDRVGLYDTDFGAGSRFMSAEDSDYIYRAWKAGYKLIYVPSLFVHHDHGRRTPAAALKLRRGYVLGRGAFYAKHMIAGDRLALQSMYWELLWSLQRQDFTTFVRDMLWLVSGFGCYSFLRSVRVLLRIT